MLRCLQNVISLISAGYPSEETKEFDYVVVVFDSFHEFLENLESKSEKEKETAKQLTEILTQWAGQNASLAHIVFVGENPFGEDRLRSGKSHTQTHTDIRATFSYFAPIHFILTPISCTKKRIRLKGSSHDHILD
jgi:hypothetical protein